MTDTFTTDFLLKTFLATHTGSMEQNPKGKNENGYDQRFDDLQWQHAWEEWQTCASAMMILFNSVVDANATFLES